MPEIVSIKTSISVGGIFGVNNFFNFNERVLILGPGSHTKRDE